MHTLPPAVWSFPQPNFLLGTTPIKAVKEAKFHELIFGYENIITDVLYSVNNYAHPFLCKAL